MRCYSAHRSEAGVRLDSWPGEGTDGGSVAPHTRKKGSRLAGGGWLAGFPALQRIHRRALNLPLVTSVPLSIQQPIDDVLDADAVMGDAGADAVECQHQLGERVAYLAQRFKLALACHIIQNTLTYLHV